MKIRKVYTQRETLSAKRPKGTKNKDHRSDYDMKVAYLQEANPARNVIHKGKTHDRLLTSPNFEELSAGWTQYQEELARHNTKTCMERTSSRTTHSPIKEEAHASTSKLIIQSKDQLYIVDSGASLHLMGDSSLASQERKTIRNI